MPMLLVVHEEVLLDKEQFTLVGLIAPQVMLLLVPLGFMSGSISMDL